MRRLNILILTLCLIIASTGCSKQDEIKSPVGFYYCTAPVQYGSSEGVISAEIRDKSQYNDFLEILNAYVKGPNAVAFHSPFPQNLQVLSVEVGDLTVVCLNDVYSQLSGCELTLACTCFSRTVIDLTGCTTVRLMCETQLLEGNTHIDMSEQDFIFLDEFTPETTQ